MIMTSTLALIVIMIAFTACGLACLGIVSATLRYINDKRIEREMKRALRKE